MQQPGDAVVTLGDLTLHRWGRDDLPVLERANTPEMTAFLGGPESEEKVRDRHERYLRYWDDGEARMFVIRMDGVEESVGSVGYWLTTWRDRPVYEAGWGVDNAYQGRASPPGRCGRASTTRPRSRTGPRWWRFRARTTWGRTRSAARSGSSLRGRKHSSIRKGTRSG